MILFAEEQNKILTDFKLLLYNIEKYKKRNKLKYYL